MDQKVSDISEKLFRRKYEQLIEREKEVARHLAERTHISRNTAKEFDEQLTFGQRLADRVATLGVPGLSSQSLVLYCFYGFC